MNGSIFTPRILLGWLAAGAAIFALSIYLTVGGDVDDATANVGPSSYSRSAIGFAGLADLLRRLGVPVSRSRGEDSAATSAGLVILAAPTPSANRERERPRLFAGRATLVVLPKWRGEPSRDRADWIDAAVPLSVQAAQWALDFAGGSGEVVQVPVEAAFSQTIGSTTPGQVEPTLAAKAQLVKGGSMRALVQSGQGILLGQVEEASRGASPRKVFVLSDPDVLANAGLGQGDNARFAVLIVDLLREGSGAVMFDETLHGLRTPAANPLALLFRFPFSVATLLAAAAFGLLLWATMGRFGPPAEPAAALGAGKMGLIANAARLLDRAGYQDVIALRYVETIIAFVGARLHAPAGLARDDLVRWLGRAAAARHVAIDCAAVLEAARSTADGAAATGGARARRDTARQAVRDIELWKRDMLDGHRGDPRRR